MSSPHRWKVVLVLSLLVLAAVACSGGLTSPPGATRETLLHQARSEDGSTFTLTGRFTT
jgi:hypothetical protein